MTPSRRMLWAAFAAPLLALLVVAQPVHAGPSIEKSTIEKTTTTERTVRVAPSGAWEPKPDMPGPVMVPGKGKQPAPLTRGRNQTMAVPKAMPGAEGGKAGTVMPGKAGEPQQRKAPADRTVDSPADEYGTYYYCTERVTKNVSANNDRDVNTTRITYTAELGCNFYLYYAYAVAAIWDPEFAQYLHATPAIEFYNGYYGYTTGTLEIPGNYYDGGRTLEIDFDLYLLLGGGYWGACNPVDGLSYRYCVGLGSSLLQVGLSSDAFSSGLNPAEINYVALGDSYSSGTGARPYTVGPTDPAQCRRSGSTYSALIARSYLGNLPISFPERGACHGAVIGDIFSPQVIGQPAQRFVIKPYTRLVTMTIGGNDLGFSRKLTQCVTSNCVASGQPLVTVSELVDTQLRLTETYRTLLSQMRADSRLVVLSYPAILPDPTPGSGDLQPSFFSCPVVNGQIDSAELAAIYRGTEDTSDMIQRAVLAVGDPRMVFVDTFEAFRGNRICADGPDWATGTDQQDLADAFHPNALGYRAMANQIIQTLGLT